MLRSHTYSIYISKRRLLDTASLQPMDLRHNTRAQSRVVYINLFVITISFLPTTASRSWQSAPLSSVVSIIHVEFICTYRTSVTTKIFFYIIIGDSTTSLSSSQVRQTGLSKASKHWTRRVFFLPSIGFIPLQYMLFYDLRNVPGY